MKVSIPVFFVPSEYTAKLLRMTDRTASLQDGPNVTFHKFKPTTWMSSDFVKPTPSTGGVTINIIDKGV